jgi:hypothetical protein
LHKKKGTALFGAEKPAEVITDFKRQVDESRTAWGADETLEEAISIPSRLTPGLYSALRAFLRRRRTGPGSRLAQEEKCRSRTPSCVRSNLKRLKKRQRQHWIKRDNLTTVHRPLPPFYTLTIDPRLVFCASSLPSSPPDRTRGHYRFQAPSRREPDRVGCGRDPRGGQEARKGIEPGVY